MADIYPSNSNKARESSLVREQVSQQTPQQNDIPRPATQERTPHKRKIAPVKEVFRAIFPGGFAELKEHLLWDIFVPWAQDMLRSGWQGLGDVIFPGSKRSSNGSVPERYSYEAQYQVRPSYSTRTVYDSSYSVDTPRPMTNDEANRVYNNMHGILAKNGFVTLLDYNDQMRIPTNSAQDNYGWINLNAMKVERIRGGWTVTMPPAVPIDRPW